jgi:hypothetical protein
MATTLAPRRLDSSAAHRSAADEPVSSLTPTTIGKLRVTVIMPPEEASLVCAVRSGSALSSNARSIS